MADLRYFYGLLDTKMNDPVAIELFDALIGEIGRLQQRIEVLERVRDWNENLR